MKCVWSLTDNEKLTLQEAATYHPVPRCRLRARLILISNKRQPIKTIAELFETTFETVSNAIERWERYGLMGLYDAERSGRPKTLTEPD